MEVRWGRGVEKERKKKIEGAGEGVGKLNWIRTGGEKKSAERRFMVGYRMSASFFILTFSIHCFHTCSARCNKRGRKEDARGGGERG